MKRGLKLKGMLRLYLKWPLFLSILFIIMDIQLFVINRRIGVIGAVYCVIFILITLILNFFGKKGIRRDLVQFAENYGKMQMNMIKEMDIPYAVLSEEGQLLWGNDKFLQVIVNKKAARRVLRIFSGDHTKYIAKASGTKRSTCTGGRTLLPLCDESHRRQWKQCRR